MSLLAVLSGIVIGFVQGLIGGGGSVLGVPALIYVVGISDPHLAIGTSALAVAVSAVVTLLAYVRSGHVKWRCGAAFTLAGVVGATLGSSLGKTPLAERPKRKSGPCSRRLLPIFSEVACGQKKGMGGVWLFVRSVDRRWRMGSPSALNVELPQARWLPDRP